MQLIETTPSPSMTFWKTVGACLVASLLGGLAMAVGTVIVGMLMGRSALKKVKQAEQDRAERMGQEVRD